MKEKNKYSFFINDTVETINGSIAYKISNIDKTIIGCITPKNNLVLNFEDQNTLQNFCSVTCIPKNELVDMDIFGPKLCYKISSLFWGKHNITLINDNKG
jgi:hypothetical protein